MGACVAMSEDITAALRTRFGIAALRGRQLEIMQRMLRGEDLLVVMQTGGGKSLLFQLPAVCRPGVTLVVSPLRALIAEQVAYLRDKDIAAFAMVGDTDAGEFSHAMHAARDGHRSIVLYATPEKVVHSEVMRRELWTIARSGKLQRVVFDEAHCIQTWGHDFRPLYIEAAESMRSICPNVPIMACTATATSEMCTDIMRALRLQSAAADGGLVVCGTVRKNMFLRVVSKKNGDASADDVVQRVRVAVTKGVVIVYTRTRRDAEWMARRLAFNELRTRPFHAGLPEDVRATALRDWHAGSIDVVCATIAFGMGLDKANVRLVLHWSIAASVPGYAQEIGRAGRDGEPAECVLYFRASDVDTMKAMMEKEKQADRLRHRCALQQMDQLCRQTARCRHAALAAHFVGNNSADDCGGMCDVCERTAA